MFLLTSIINWSQFEILESIAKVVMHPTVQLRRDVNLSIWKEIGTDGVILQEGSHSGIELTWDGKPFSRYFDDTTGTAEDELIKHLQLLLDVSETKLLKDELEMKNHIQQRDELVSSISTLETSINKTRDQLEALKKL